MIVPIDRVLPSPWRDFERYPLSEERIAVVSASIGDTGLWPNVLARPAPDRPGHVELAYGHTRVEAARRRGIQEIDIAVREISDDEMLRIMVAENATQVGHNTPANNHAVAQISRHLAREILLAEAMGGWAHLAGEGG